MREGNIDTAKLEGILSEDARRFLNRAKEYFEVSDIMFPTDSFSYSLAHVLNSLSALTARQDAVFELIRRGKDLPAFMPIEADRLIGSGTSLAHLASEKDAVIALFGRLGEIGYTDSQFKMKCERDGKEYNAYINRFNPTLYAADGIVKLAQNADLTVKTLQGVQREFGQTLPLYFTFDGGLSMPTDGVFFNSENALELGCNFDAIAGGVRRVGIIDTGNTDGSKGDSIHNLYRYPKELAQLGARVNEVEEYARLVNGEPRIDTTYFHLKWLTPVILEQLDSPQLMGLLRELQPYAVKKGQGSGMSLHIQTPLNLPEHHHLLRVQNARRLAAEHGDKVIAFAKAMHDYGAQFSLSDLASDYDSAVALVGQAAELGGFADEIRKYKQLTEIAKPRQEMWSMPPSAKLSDYNNLVREGLSRQKPLVRLVKELNEKCGFKFTSGGLQEVLRSAVTIDNIDALRIIDVNAVVDKLQVSDGEYRIEMLSYAVQESQRQAA